MQDLDSESPFWHNNSSRLLSGCEHGVAIASKQRVHMAKQSLHLTTAVGCPVVDSNLAASHLLNYILCI